MRHAVARIFKEEGLTAYWRGHVPGQGLSILYGAISIGLYQTTWYYSEHKGLGFSNTRTKSVVADLLIGTGAAVPATVLLNHDRDTA